MSECRITNGLIRFAILLFILLLSSCAKLDRPLSDPEKAKPDSRLFGVWKCMEVEKKGSFNKDDFLFLGKSDLRGSPPGIMKCVEICTDKENNIFTIEPIYFFTTSIGNRNYANLLEMETEANEVAPAVWDKRKYKEILLVKYKVEEDSLVIWWIDSEVAEALIRKGQLKGRIREGRGLFNSTEVTLTDTEGLARFLANGGDKRLFPDKTKMVFSRVK